MPRVNAAFDISRSFLIFRLRPLIESSLSSFLSALFFSMFTDLTFLFISSSFLKKMKACVNGFAWRSILAIFDRHSYFCYRLPQQSFDLCFRCFIVESCCYSFALILVAMGCVGSISFDFTFFI